MQIYNQSVFEKWPIEDNSIQVIITSPPYYSLRKYNIPDVIIGGKKDCYHLEKNYKHWLSNGQCMACGAWQGQYGLEPDYKLYLTHCKLWMQEAIRVLRDDGIIFVNLGDSYNGSGGQGNQYKQAKIFGNFHPHRDKDYPLKSKLLIPERFAIMCVDELGLILRNHICWTKPNAMPESVTDRFSKKWESIFMFTKQPKYYFNLDNVREKAPPLNRWGGNKLRAKGKSIWDEGTKQSTYRDRDMQPNDGMKNPGDCWAINTQPSPEKHFAMWPEKLVERMILCSTKIDDTVLDPFCGSGTTGRIALQNNRRFIGIDLGYSDIQKHRMSNIQKKLRM